MGAYVAKPLSRCDIRCVARVFQKLMGNEYCFDIIKFLEHKLPKIDPEFTLEIVEDTELFGAYAAACPYEHLIKVRESVYEGAIKGNGRDRFTLCHELGHYIFHKPENVIFLRADRDIETYRDPEWQANTFAGELLVPVHAAMEYPIEDIVQRCCVSYTVAEIQKKSVLKTKKSHQTALKFGGIAR